MQPRVVDSLIITIPQVESKREWSGEKMGGESAHSSHCGLDNLVDWLSAKRAEVPDDLGATRADDLVPTVQNHRVNRVLETHLAGFLTWRACT